jgi:outer membrane PBP1 activator LpoA protein
MPYRLFLSVIFVGLCAAGCSTKMAYFSAQEMQRAQCDKQTDLQELQRCRAQIKQSYDDYQRQREEVKTTPAP